MSTVRSVVLLALFLTVYQALPVVAQPQAAPPTVTPIFETAVGPVDSPSIRAPLSQPDVRFAREASELNMAQIMAGQIAVRRGGTTAVREFGARMVIDHADLQSLLLGVTARKGIAPPLQPDAERKETIYGLGNKTGKSFDNLFIRSQIDIHEKMVALFEEESTHGTDPALRAIAIRALPQLRVHLSGARRLDETDGESSGLPPLTSTGPSAR